MINNEEYEIPDNCIGHAIIIIPEEHTALLAGFNLRDHILIGRTDSNFAHNKIPKKKDGSHDGQK